MCVCVCLYMCVCAHTRVCVYVCMHASVCVCVYLCYNHVHVCHTACEHGCTRVCKRVHMCGCLYKCVPARVDVLVHISISSGTCVLWPLRLTKSAQGILIFQVILHEKLPFGTSIKCVDYAGVLIVKCPH